jgi:4-oxalocrotonate tautomerase
MPIIHDNMYEGRTIDQKRKLVTAVTDAVVKSLEVKPDAVRIILHEIPKHNLAVAGVLASDRK